LSFYKLTIAAAIILVVFAVIVLRYADEIDGAEIQIEIPEMGAAK
jgi:hypothetical protein